MSAIDVDLPVEVDDDGRLDLIIPSRLIGIAVGNANCVGSKDSTKKVSGS